MNREDYEKLQLIIRRYESWNELDIEDPKPKEFPSLRQVIADITELVSMVEYYEDLENQAAYNSGYEDGYDAGRESGYDAGYEDCKCDMHSKGGL